VNHSTSDARCAGAWRRAPLRHASLCAAILACFIGSGAQAQQEDLYTVSYRDADIRTVAEQVQKVIGRPIIIDPRANGRVTMFSNAPMNADAFYRTFLAALEIRGLVARESGNTIMIVPLEENRE
jgi:general secretion pathway protein D